MSKFELASAEELELLEESDAVQQPHPQLRRKVFFGIFAVVGMAIVLVAVKPIGFEVGPYHLATRGYEYTKVDATGFEQKVSQCVGGVGCCTVTSTSASCQSCFPGHAEVQTQEHGVVKINSLQAGDRVLVESSSGNLLYEPVLSFLHFGGVGTQTEFLAIRHATGKITLTANHMVFIAGASGPVATAADHIASGDEILVVPAGTSEGAAPSRVLSVTREVSNLGIFAPLTPSGKIVVDGTVASNYATASGVHFGHAASHAAFFPVRAYHELGLSSLLAPYLGHAKGPETEVHPLAAFFMATLLPVMS